MQQITISSATFKRLQSHAEPLVDTEETVINRALDALEQLPTQPVDVDDPTPVTELQFDPSQLPDMTHTKILDAAVAGTGGQKPHWNDLLKMMVRSAVANGRTFDEIRQLCSINMVSGQKGNQKYCYLSDIDISLRNQNANTACQALVTLAQNLGIALDIVFEWRDKEGAAYSRQRGRLRIPGSASA